MAQIEQLYDGLRKADAAGNAADAKQFAQAIASYQSDSAAPPASTTAPPELQPSLMQRAHDSIFVPKGQEDKTPGFGGAADAFKSIPQEIGKEASSAASQVGRDIFPQSMEDLERLNSSPLPGGQLVMDAMGVLGSPLTGALNSVLGRPVEAATGLRRELTGGVASMAIPFAADAAGLGKVAKATEAVEGADGSTPSIAEHAVNHGYVLPPQMLSKKPGVVADLLGGWSGKIKTQQAASARNQEITNRLAARALGLPEDTQLQDAHFEKIREDAGKAYQAVKAAVPNIKADEKYDNIVEGLGGSNSQAAHHFPNITKNQAILDLVSELKNVKDFPTEAGVEVVKELRSSATANLKALGDPSKHALGLAQRQAADAIDDLMQRNIEAAGKPGIVEAYKAARKQIAKSYDVQGATNSVTGNVSARGLAKLGQKGRPFTDELKTISDVASAFPKAMQSESEFGGNEPLSAVDFFGSALAVAHGNPSVAGAILGRPIARSLLLSKGRQRSILSPEPWQAKILPAAQYSPFAAGAGDIENPN